MNDYNSGKKSNTGLIVAVSVLGSVLIGLIVVLVLNFSGIISLNVPKDNYTETTPPVSAPAPQESKKVQASAPSAPEPTVWTYDEEEAEDFIANSLRAFVNGINTRSTDYVYTYFSGAAATEEIKSNNIIVKSVVSEEILSLDCHSVQRISNSQITVIRDSVIRVVYNDGKVKDIPERYKYTVDLSSGLMKIVALTAM